MEAQTTTPEPLTITAVNIPSANHAASISLRSTGVTNTWISIEGQNIGNYDRTADHIGSVYGKRDTLLKEDQLFAGVAREAVCGSVQVRSVKTLLTETNAENAHPKLAVPDNITPKTNDTVHAIGLDFYHGDTNTKPKCTPDIDANNPTKPLLTRDGKELRWIITGKHDKEPYYFSPRENILQAQKVPICTRDNFNTTTQTLKGTLEMCYGKNSNDMIIISKRITGYYGTADTVTELAPANKVDFTGTTTNQADPNNDSDEYKALLKRLYLPPI